MSEAVLQHIEHCQADLLGALDSHDLLGLEAAITGLKTALEEAPDTWRRSAETREMAERIAGLAQAAQMRVNFLTDQVRSRLERLSVARGHGPCATYGATGR